MSQRKITTEKAVKELAKQGIVCTDKEAAKIVDFLYLLAKIAVSHYFNEDKE